MERKLKIRIIVAVSGLAFAFAIHWLNVSVSELPSWVHATADDASYIRPAENFADLGTWKDNTTGASSFVQRPPLMGALHFIFYKLFGDYSSLAGMVFAFLLHGIALFFLPLILEKFVSFRRAILLTLIYALLPCFWGFLSYQITESISSSLLILTVATAFSTGRFSIAGTLLLLTACWLLRPVLIFLLFGIIVLVILKIIKAGKNIRLTNIFVLCVCLLISGAWEVRQHHYMQTWLDPHPIYHASNETMFRPAHRELTKVFQVWETKPEDFHALCDYYFAAARNEDPILKKYYAAHDVPMSFKDFEFLMDFYSYAETDRLTLQRGPNNPGETDAERNFREFTNDLIPRLKSGNKLQYYVKTPLKSAKEMLSKSQLNLEMFQDRFRGAWLMEIIRYLSLGIILLSLVFSFAAFFTRNRNLILLAAGIFLYLETLFFVQRMCEDRYMLPALPLMLICGGAAFFLIIDKVWKKRKV